MRRAAPGAWVPGLRVAAACLVLVLGLLVEEPSASPAGASSEAAASVLARASVDPIAGEPGGAGTSTTDPTGSTDSSDSTDSGGASGSADGGEAGDAGSSGAGEADPATDEGGGSPPSISDVVDSLGEACGIDPSWACETVYDATGNQTLAGFTEWFVARPLTALGILLVAFFANRVLRRVAGRAVLRMVDSSGGLLKRAPGVLQSTMPHDSRSTARAATLTGVVKSLVTVFVYATAFAMVLGTFDIALGPLIAGAGIVGVALGFGAQTIVRDFLSGFFMMVEDQFGVGDVVEVGGVIGTSEAVTGTVERMTLRSTRLRDVNGTVWHIPNGEIRRIGNKSQEWARSVLDVTVAYDADVEVAQEVIRAAADEVVAEPKLALDVLEPPEVWGIEEIGPEGVTIRLVVKVRPASQWRINRELRPAIKSALDEAGIAMPQVPGSVPAPAPVDLEKLPKG